MTADKFMKLLGLSLAELAINASLFANDFPTIAVIEENRLYLSGHAAAENIDLLKIHGITHVLNVTKDNPPQPNVVPGLKLKYLPLCDDLYQPLTIYWEEVMDFLDRAFSEAGRVLIHCSAGQSRSASFVIYYLMARRGMPLFEAYEYVRERKPDIGPNHHFMAELQKAEMDIFGTCDPRFNLRNYKVQRLKEVFQWVPEHQILGSLTNARDDLERAAEILSSL